MNRWKLLPEKTPSPDLLQVAKEQKLNPLIVKLLAKRGFDSRQDIVDFLDPKLADLPDPFLMKNMKKAATIISDQIQKGRPILVWGDYDVDGTTGTAILVEFFQESGVNTSYFIPDRLEDGYGLNSRKIEELNNDKKYADTKPLIVTVDCGISANKEIELARKLGFSIIITDHHQPPEKLSDADAIINPKQDGCLFPEKNLAGVGVAFYLIIAVRSMLRKLNFWKIKDTEPDIRKYLDLVAMGTVADVVPLTKTNRILVKNGMELIQAQTRKGLSMLAGSSGLLKGDNTFFSKLTSEDISFLLAPRINAAGRLGNAGISVDLFLCQNNDKAKKLASKLERLNKKRRDIETEASSRALLLAGKEARDVSCNVIAGEFHQGVVGISASRLVDKFKKPAILLAMALDNEGKKILKGSARSVEGVNLYQCLVECSSSLSRYGGHEMAAGMTLNADLFPVFKKEFQDAVKRQLEKKQKQLVVGVDLVEDMEKIFDFSFLRGLNAMEPFGEGNKAPLFMDPNPRIATLGQVGSDDNHLKIAFHAGARVRRGIGFGLGHVFDSLQTVRRGKILYRPIANRFRNCLNWEVRVVDVDVFVPSP